MFKHAVTLAALVVPILAPIPGSTDEPATLVIQEHEARTLAAKTPGFKNLQRIGLAFHGYHDIFGRFPPAILYAPDGKTPYSWRVELLPALKHYVDGVDPDAFARARASGNTDRDAYNELIAACGYDITQPWDSPKNRSALPAIPDVYRHPGENAGSVTAAYYAVVGSGTAFDPRETSKYADIKGWPAGEKAVERCCNRVLDAGGYGCRMLCEPSSCLAASKRLAFIPLTPSLNLRNTKSRMLG